MIEVIVSIVVNAEPATAFAYWADWTNNPTWQTGMDRCAWTSEPPLQIGSTYDQRATMMGRPIVSSFEVVELVRDRRVRIRTTQSTLPLDITREVAPGPDGGSTLTATVQGTPQGPMRLLNPLMRRMVRRNVAADYDRLKVILDAM